MKKEGLHITQVSDEISAIKLQITGLVQGVGFRPFIYRLANIYDLKGWVDNSNAGVEVRLEGNEKSLGNFLSTIRIAAPSASSINNIDWKIVGYEGFTDFSIIKSKDNNSGKITEISPDIAVCTDCLMDMKSQQNRIDYPFINCTNCGPRFSIIKSLPYDRKNTSMHDFQLCPVCKSEYLDVKNRRFHAQPVACKICGPSYELIIGSKHHTDFSIILKKISRLTQDGKIIAIKGMGGFHLMCDALQEETVIRLRKTKIREAKPFALMFKDLITLKEYVELNQEEEKLVTSWQRPIVLLKQKKLLPIAINQELNSLGCFLPYLPLHHLMFEHLKTSVIVLTSGNKADEPIAIGNNTARKNLAGIYDAILINNRDIINRTDDSVCMVVNGKSRLIRRSRSYAPAPINLPFSTEGIFAAGAELANCFAIGKDHQAIASQYIGDLKNLETYKYFKYSFQLFSRLFRFRPTFVIHDLHPDYLSTKFAVELDVKSMAVQHHWAHIASCMAENNLDEKVIGIALDGTGFGTDGTIWGGEFLICDLSNFERYSHFEAIPLPGGDKVIHQPWRSTLAYLYSYFKEEIWSFDFVNQLNRSEIEIILQALDQKINCPLSSSAGRLFDAVASLIGVCRNSTYHAEAPMRLEAILINGIEEYYSFSFDKIISFKKMFKEIINDLKSDIAIGVISAKFHNTIIEVIVQVAEQIRMESGLQKAALSGGSFQNKYLLEKTENRLSEMGFDVYSQHKFPSNDGGIALGQLAIAAKEKNVD
ncbi:MAG: carbamoyltransferase HypF [Bacteroidales bacterium]|jgi:hydrogenase maturation protein HypF|nr:carbamoyltransferase HypF [Bacteroidales bacterium]